MKTLCVAAAVLSVLVTALGGCAHLAERTAVEEFGAPAPTGICRVDNLRALEGDGIIVSGLFRNGTTRGRHLTVYKESDGVFRRLDLTCPDCELVGRPFLVILVKNFEVAAVYAPVREFFTPLPMKLAYITTALRAEKARRQLQASH